MLPPLTSCEMIWVATWIIVLELFLLFHLIFKFPECLFHSDSYKILCLYQMFAFGAHSKYKLSYTT